VQEAQHGNAPLFVGGGCERWLVVVLRAASAPEAAWEVGSASGDCSRWGRRIRTKSIF
jgi:hypothetical protein